MSALAPLPFFIVGHPRSGTTLLRFIMSSHPRLFIPEETGFLPFLGLTPGALLTLSDVRALLERIGQLNYLWRDTVEDVPAFFEQMAEPTTASFLNTLYQRHLSLAGVETVRWGDKTPLYVTHIPYLAELLPGASFIHIIRDGRDAALSALQKWPEHSWYMDFYYLLRNWARNVNAGRKAGQALGPSLYLEVQYEQLVTDPETVVHQICDFLGESFYPGMLDQAHLARKVGPGPHGHTEVQQAISTSSVARWQQELSLFEQKLANHIAGTTLVSCGYTLANAPSLTTSERLRLAFMAGRFQLFDSARSVLYATGVLTFNRDLRQQRGNRQEA